MIITTNNIMENNMDTKELAQVICKFLSDKKAEDIVKIAVGEKTTIADYFIIASGRTVTQVKALAENLDEYISSLGLNPIRTEGIVEGRWAVLDYGGIIVHLFNDTERLFYHLERLWGEGEKIDD